MCGIAGIIGFKHTVSESDVKKMTDALAHRGPDGDGIWMNEENNACLGHRRLAIIDLSDQGAQPMHSESGRYTIIFNGEIYNYVELRQSLIQAGHKFKTENDTEVLLRLFELKGKDCLADLDGMFAFAVWDSEKKELFCARDRFGEKPFYYFFNGRKFAFASEIKALWSIGIKKECNPVMAFNYEFFGYTTNPDSLSETFYSNILSLPHSHYLILNDNKVTTHRYYSIDPIHVHSAIDSKIAEEKLRALFSDSVKKRLRGQVTVGSSFSGGLDSSIIVSVIDQIKKGSGNPLQIFSAIFPDFEKNEERYIKQMIAGKNIDAHYILSDREKYEQIISKLFYQHEEPFTSLSVVAQYFIYQKAREKNVTVLLDGQGADEVFGGYHAYYNSFLRSLYQTNKRNWYREYKAYQNVNKNNSINPKINLGLLKQIAAEYFPNLLVRRRENKLKSQLSKDRIDFYQSHLKDKFEIRNSFNSLTEELHYQAFTFGLPTLLKYADRNSMANGVEIRLPFLDHKIVEFLFTLPDSYKIQNGWTKWILRETYKDLLPKEICWRTDKIGLEPNAMTNVLSDRKIVLDRFEKEICSKSDFR